jgi:basic amino acid/polyamine antiporter, APA family
MTVNRAAGRLRRILGIGFDLAVIIGATIGIGILRTPGLITGQLQAPGTILLVWIAGGLFTLLSAICLTELGTMIPQAGGFYVYARRAFGDWVGFAIGWNDWIAYATALSYISIGMAEFLGELVPPVAGAVRPVAVALLVGFVALQWAGVRVSSWFQSWTTALKCLAFLALVAVGLVMSGGISGAAPTRAFASPTLTGLVVALPAVVITFGGWQSALYFTEEDRDPVRNLPRAMIGGVLVVIVIYMLVNIAFLAILPIPQFAASKLPAADAAQVIVGERGRQIITVLSILSLLPLLNAIMMVGTRILFALGRDRLFWSRAADVNARGTPGVATLVTTLVAIVLIATIGTFERLIAMTTIFLALNYAVCCLALIALRRREPATARPFRAWGYPWSAAIVVAVALYLLYGALIADTSSALMGLGLLAVGLAGHAVHRRMR